MPPVQAILFLYLFLLFSLALSQPVFFIDQSGPNLVRFSGNWNTTSHPSALGGSNVFTSEPAAQVSIVLPWTFSTPPSNPRS